MVRKPYRVYIVVPAEHNMEVFDFNTALEAFLTAIRYLKEGYQVRLSRNCIPDLKDLPMHFIDRKE